MVSVRWNYTFGFKFIYLSQKKNLTIRQKIENSDGKIGNTTRVLGPLAAVHLAASDVISWWHWKLFTLEWLWANRDQLWIIAILLMRPSNIYFYLSMDARIAGLFFLHALPIVFFFLSFFPFLLFFCLFPFFF